LGQGFRIYERILIELNDLDEPIWSIQQVLVSNELLIGTLDHLIGLLLNICSSWEDVSEERKEKWDTVSDEFISLELRLGTSHDHFFI
jgi:hypothetical protein